MSATYPLNKEKIEKGTLYASAFDEVFLGPEKGDTWFKRNRLFAGFGYRIDSPINTNFGYVWQREFSDLKGNRNYHFIYFAINFTFDRMAKAKQNQKN